MSVVVTGLGCYSAVGPTVEQTCSSIRAGIMRSRSNEEYIAQAPEFAEGPPDPITYAPAPSVPSGQRFERRLGMLAARAVADLAPRAGLTRAAFDATHLMLALPETAREGVTDPDPARLARGLRKATSLALIPEPRVFQAGHVAALLALDAARQVIADNNAARCLIVAVDSNVLDAHLDWLDQAWRLKSQRNVDGFIPGEAAVAILVESASEAARRKATILARIAGIGVADEPKPSTSDVQSTGAGLSGAIGAACPDAAKQPLAWVICDMNGESYRAREWGLALTRLASGFSSPAVWHPAENTGDVGAASGALHVAIAASAFTRRYAPADRALVWCASDSARRAACVIGDPDRAASHD